MAIKISEINSFYLTVMTAKAIDWQNKVNMRIKTIFAGDYELSTHRVDNLRGNCDRYQ